MRILLLVHDFNSLSQRMFLELQAAGNEVTIEFDINDGMTSEAISLFAPDVIIAPYLKRAIPVDIWRKHLCLIVHPGIVGDRGASALDWAIMRGEQKWGITVIQAEEEMDAGPIWATREFPMREATKSSLYRSEVADCAVGAVFEALEKLERGQQPRRLEKWSCDVHGRLRPSIFQDDRTINWSTDSTSQVLRKIRAADGVPGVRHGTYFLYDGHEAIGLSGKAGEILATSGPSVCFATVDGAIWIGHIRDPKGKHTFKLPATRILSPNVPEIPLDCAEGYREIEYREDGDIGYLRFDFYNGAMSTGQCNRLKSAYLDACNRPTRVIVLEGGEDFWSNGIHLNTIEAATSAADESWENINAMNDLAEAIIRTQSHLTVTAMNGNAGAGGVFLARCSDLVWLREAVVLNPHYKDMGNLYGSEFWTYLLPRYCGEANAKRIAEARLPMGSSEAVSLGLADASFGQNRQIFSDLVSERANILANVGFEEALKEKQSRRAVDESVKPLEVYRAEELSHMKKNFYGFDPSYHVARYNFVHKVCKSRTPITLAQHRDKRASKSERRAT